MVKQSRVLEEAASEADIPYAQTRLARQATRARSRLAVLLLAGAGAALLEAGITRGGFWLLAAGAFSATAWLVWRGRMGGAVAAALVAVVATLVPLYFIFAATDVGARVLLAFVAVWGAAMLPLVVTLLRDFELQHAYGLWARRE